MPPNEFEFEWDDRKNRANLNKHGFDFGDSDSVFDGPTLLIADTREDYGENRWQAIANLNGVVVVIVLVETEEPNRFRVISFRRANGQEREEYEAYIEDRLGSGASDEGF